MKKIILIGSLVLNVLLMALCIYMMSKPKKRAKDMQMVHYFSLQHRIPVKEGDILFWGGERFSLCNWMELIGDQRIRNRALSGNTIKVALLKLNEIQQSKPSKLVLQFGLEDLSSVSDANQIILDYGAFVDSVRKISPQTEIIIQSLQPIDDVYSKVFLPKLTNLKVFDMNQLIRKMAKERSLTYVNLYDDLLDPKTGSLKSQYSLDGYHLNNSAYIIWKDRIVSFF